MLRNSVLASSEASGPASTSTVPKSFGMTVMFFVTVSPPTVKVTSWAPAEAL